jgi:hypothetical protein
MAVGTGKLLWAADIAPHEVHFTIFEMVPAAHPPRQLYRTNPDIGPVTTDGG